MRLFTAFWAAAMLVLFHFPKQKRKQLEENLGDYFGFSGTTVVSACHLFMFTALMDLSLLYWTDGELLSELISGTSIFLFALLDEVLPSSRRRTLVLCMNLTGCLLGICLYLVL